MVLIFHLFPIPWRLAGAVQVGTANFVDIEAPIKIIEGLKSYI